MNSPVNPPMIFGEVLFDCFPDGAQVLGGAPFNVAWHLQAFGLNPYFVSRVGDDDLGERILSAMSAWGLSTDYVPRDERHPTGVVEVKLSGGEPTFRILPDRAYDYIDAEPLASAPEPCLVYHGSLALRHAASRTALETLKSRYAPKLFVDVNLRDPWWKRDDVLAWVGEATWCKLNQDELAALVPEPSALPDRAAALQARCGLELLVVTRGQDGAFARTASGEVHDVRPGGPVGVLDTVGAGDAFASVLLLGVIRGWALEELLQRAQAFASAVLGLRGAVTDDKGFYRPFLGQWGMP